MGNETNAFLDQSKEQYSCWKVAAVPAQLVEGEKEIVFEHAVGLSLQQHFSRKGACLLTHE